jgi:hypothetical protein
MWRVMVLLSKGICPFQIKENNLTGRGNRLCGLRGISKDFTVQTYVVTWSCFSFVMENCITICHTADCGDVWITWDIQRLHSSDSCCYLILLFLCNGKLYHYMSYHRLWRPNICIYRVSQELRSLLLDLIPELILSQKCHMHMGPICNGSGVMSF